MITDREPWVTANQRYLTAELAALRARLEERATPGDRERVQAIAAEMQSPPALESLGAAFGLSSFERDLLALCAGVELDSAFASLCGRATGSPTATLGLALAVLPDAHWSALLPDAPLRRWRLLELGAGPSLVSSPLRIDERVLHYLTGLGSLDERLLGLLRREPPTPLALSHAGLAARLAEWWRTDRQERRQVELLGPRAGSRRSIAAAAAASLGLDLYVLAAPLLPQPSAEVVALARLWGREAVLGNAALLIECDDVGADAPAWWNLERFLQETGGIVMLGAPGPGPVSRDAVASFEIPEPAAAERRGVWLAALEDTPGLNGQLDVLQATFDLSPSAVRSAARVARSAPAEVPFSRAFWDACRLQARPHLGGLAEQIESSATWDDLVLPDGIATALRRIEIHVRQRAVVYGRWAFQGFGGRGRGITALFAGASGTGKTLAAEVLANTLRLDLYRIDLSQVVSKYIGETEKNLRRIFDAAEGAGAVLLFDEADALFGKRTQVRDSHDRFANIEIGYLLQRMEAYSGLAILTTNTRDALDQAFLRRLRFVVEFPFPDAPHRAEIWRRVFPAGVPLRDLEHKRLARLAVSGGHIHNIALHAAFLAADAGEPVAMSHLLDAARVECAKIEKPLTDAEVAGWV